MMGPSHMGHSAKEGTNVGTLVTLDKLRFPAIRDIHPPASNAQGWDLDFGPNWRSGILRAAAAADWARRPKSSCGC